MIPFSFVPLIRDQAEEEGGICSNCGLGLVMETIIIATSVAFPKNVAYGYLDLSVSRSVRPYIGLLTFLLL